MIYNASAVVLGAVAIALTCRRLRTYLPAWIVALSFLAVPTSGEIFGTITNAQWFLQFTLAAYCLVPAEQASTPSRTALRVLGIFLIALTGPFSAVLLLVIVGMLGASWLARRSGLDPFAGALRDFAGSRSPLYQLAAADRHFYLAKVVWWWAVWMALGGVSRRGQTNATVITVALISLFAVTNSSYLRRGGFVDFAWRDHARQLDQPGNHSIPVNPTGWGIEVETAPTGKDE